MSIALLKDGVDYVIDEKWEFHLGKLGLEAMKKNSNRVHQIDVVNDIVETHGSVRLRSIRVAQALKKRGLGFESIIYVCGPNHNDICLPIISALYIGAGVMPIGENQTLEEWCYWLKLCRPEIIFCQNNQADVAESAVKKLNLNLEIVCFGECDKSRFTHFGDLLKETGTEESFKATDFDPETTTAIINCTSGTSGFPKAVCVTHKQLALTFHLPAIDADPEDLAHHISLCSSTIFWLSGTLHILICMLYGQSRLHSPLPFTADLAVATIKKYRPTWAALVVSAIANILNHPTVKEADLSCFEYIMFMGTVPSQKLVKALKTLSPNTELKNCYGATECTGILSVATVDEEKTSSCGKMVPWVEWKIVDQTTFEKLGPNQQGELWIRGPSCFRKYVNDPETTKKAITEDGWYKSGDIMYYDEDEYVYFVDRQKELLKYKGYHISPMELELVICRLEGVLRACVVGEPTDHGDITIAFVEKTPNSKITADDVRNIVKDTLADWKHIRGGVVFMDSLPLLPSGKTNRKLLKTMIHSVQKE